MRHFYLRLVFGIIWLIAAIASAINFNFPFAAFYAVLGIVFLFSAHSIRNQEKGGRR